MKLGLNGWLEKLAGKQIPILKQSRDQMLEILSDEDRSSSECQPIILSDPGMAANLFRAMNQERLSANRLPITTVSSLVSLFGVSRLLQEVESMTCIEDLELPEINLNGIQRCLKQSWYCCWFAMKWVTDRGAREPEEVHIAAVLQSLPELMLWCYGDDALPQIEHRAYYECQDYYYEVENQLGCHKRDIGAALAQDWALPEIAGFGFESDYSSYTHGTAVALASLLARLCQHGWYGKDMKFFQDKAMHYFGENENKAIRHIHQQVLEIADEEMELGYRPVASMLVFADDKKYPELLYRLQQKESETKPVAQVKTEKKPVEDLPEKTESVNGINQQKFDTDLEQFKLLVKKQSGLNELIKHIVMSLHKTLSFNRVSFLVLTADKKALNAKINLLANNTDESTRNLSIDVQAPGLFNLLMKKPQIFVLNESNREKFWNKIPGDVKLQIQVDNFCVASVFVGDKPLGMLYADKMEDSITAEYSNAFQKITMMLNKGLELVAKK